MIKLILFTSLLFGASKNLPDTNPYSDWSKPADNVLQCDSYPDDYKPQDTKFDPGSYPWPAVNGMKQNKFGPFACGSKLPSGGLTVAGGKYYWTVAGVERKDVSDEKMTRAKESRRQLSSSQKFLLLRLEAANPNWAYNLEKNGIEFTPIEVSLKCILDRTVFKTTDGKYYYHNYYRYLGITESDADYIPTRELRDYLAPEALKAYLNQVCK